MNKKPRKLCRMCGKECLIKFCSIKCMASFALLKTELKILNRKKVGRAALRNYLLRTRGNKCEICGHRNWQGKKLPVEMEHKDGNSDNNTLANLLLLCPNCHSQTPTYKARNKGNGRHSRRERYNKGLSY